MMIRFLIISVFVEFACALTCNTESGNSKACYFSDLTDSTSFYYGLTNMAFNTFITKIYFKNCLLTHIPKELTVTFKALDELDVSKTNLWRLKKIDFDSTTRFKKLNISFNAINRIEALVTSGMVNLENLDLSHNSIDAIEIDGIKYNENLKFLNISHNRIGKLDGNFFRNVRSVKILNLSNNKISSLSCGFCDFVMNFEEFYLQHNQLVSFNPVIANSVKLLDLSSNNIAGEIKFSTLTALTNLNIRGNSLEYLAINNNLEKLDASDNTERSFAISFGNNKALTSLALSNLDIVHYEDILAVLNQFGKLVNLDLSENNLEHFDLKVHNLPQSLETLNLRRTDLHSLLNWKSLRTLLPNLKEVNIVDNFLSCSELPSILEKFEELNVNIVGLSTVSDNNEFVKKNCADDSHRKRKPAQKEIIQNSSDGLLWTFLIICLLGNIIAAVLYLNFKYNFVGMIVK